MRTTLGTHARLALVLGAALLPLAAQAEEAAPRVDHQAVARATKGERLILRARIVSMSGLPVAEPVVFVRLPGVMGFSRLSMKPDPAFQDLFAAEIPAAYVVADLDYYLEAFDADGNGPGRSGSPEAPIRVVVAAEPVAAVVPAAASAVPLAYLRVVTTPSNAMVSIDGQRIGTTPQLAPVLAGMAHRVLIESEGYRSFEKTAPPLSAGTEGQVSLVLEPKPSNFLVTASFILFQPGMFNGDQDFGFGDAVAIAPYGNSGESADHFAVESARGVDLSLTYVLADHHGIVLDMTYTSLELQTDVSGYEDQVVASGKTYGSCVGYRALLGPWSVFRPRLGLLLGARFVFIEEGDSSLGWMGKKDQLYPVVDPELGFALELPGHVSLDVFMRVGVLSFFKGLPVNTFGAGFGGHF